MDWILWMVDFHRLSLCGSGCVGIARRRRLGTRVLSLCVRNWFIFRHVPLHHSASAALCELPSLWARGVYAWMAMPRAFRIGWVQITFIGFFLLAGNCAWFYFHEWPAIRDWLYPDYHPSVARRLISFSGLTLFFGGLIFGLSRWIFRFARRLLSLTPRVR